MPAASQRFRLLAAALVATMLVLVGIAACSTAGGSPPSRAAGTPGGTPASSAAAGTVSGNLLPGMPPPLKPDDLYAADGPNMLADAVKHDVYRVYVPNNGGDSVTEIDPTTYKVLSTTPVPHSPEHVAPSWDLRTLWVNSDQGNALTPIDPLTGNIGTPVPVDDPYNLYFTPDGRYAVVMAEAHKQIVFRDPHTMQVVNTVQVPCSGVNHTDFSPDGRYFIASCEFSGDLVKVDTVQQKVVGRLHLPGRHPMPQDVKISPDGRTWYIADMDSAGVWILNGDTFTTPTLLPTGLGAHGLYVSRDSRYLYISNRAEGSVSVLEFATGKLIAKWKIPGGGSPDMGGLSPNGKILWLSGRYNSEVYVISTVDGHLITKIRTPANPHGLCVWPQPGRYSMGHTGILR